LIVMAHRSMLERLISRGCACGKLGLVGGWVELEVVFAKAIAIGDSKGN
jgi:hypothetical protein